MSRTPQSAACGEVYHLALAQQRPIYCEEPPDHAGEHRASEPDGDVWWGRHRA